MSIGRVIGFWENLRSRLQKDLPVDCKSGDVSRLRNRVTGKGKRVRSGFQKDRKLDFKFGDVNRLSNKVIGPFIINQRNC